MRRNPFATDQQQIRRLADRAAQTPEDSARPTEAVASLQTVGRNRDTGCDTGGAFYVCGILGFTPLGSFILCSVDGS